ncbi:MAG: hypothetical protein Tsb0034_04430 [Ekhidna sp.]
MKKSTLILSFFLLSTLVISQTVYVVDNNANAPSGDYIFPTIQEAVDAAMGGDYIYIQPSPTKYGGTVIVDKELHFVGIGFNLTKDIPHQSVITNLRLQNNVDNTSNASNSTITGLIIDNIYFNRNASASSFTLDNVKIYNNLISQITYTQSTSFTVPLSNIEIYSNRITSTVLFYQEVSSLIIRNNLLQGALIFDSANPNSAVVTNNIMYGAIGKDSAGDNVIIQNNYFLGSNGSNVAFNNMLDATIANNVFYGRTPSNVAAGGSTSANFQRNIFTNNLSYETGNDELPPAGGGGIGNSGDGNIESDSPEFTDVDIVNTWSSDFDFTLSGSSPLLNAGSDGTNIGITGGPYPYTASNFDLRTTALPTIEILNTSTIINPDDDLDVRVKAKSN